MYQLLRPTAYEPDPDFAPWEEDLHVIAFSEQWRTQLLQLDRLRHPKRDRPFTPHVKQLNALLRAMAPGVVATGRHAGTNSEVPWIYALSPVPEDVVAPLVTAWVLGGYADEERAIEVLGAMYDTVPAWTTDRVQLGSAALSSGGTAVPERRLYSLVPDVLAARLAARRYRPAGLDRDIRFRVVDRDQGTQLVSWPPQRYAAKGREWFYSASITITLHTAPFRPGYRVHVESGIRRWTTNSAIDVFGSQPVGVMLDVPLPWAEATNMRAARLITHQIGYRRDLRRVDWLRYSPAHLLPDLDIMRTFPDAMDIIREPRTWLEGRDAVAAGVIHRNGRTDHEVEAGFFPGERALLDGWVEEGLRPLLRRAPDLERTLETHKPQLFKKPPKSADSEVQTAATQTIAAARREALAACLAGKPLNIDILWQFSTTRKQLLAALADVLGFPARTDHDQHDQEWHFRGLHIRIRSAELGKLGAALDLSRRGGLTAAATLGEGIRARQAAVAERFESNPDGTSITFAEINPKKLYPDDSDPKFALRLGFAATGRLTKFLVAEKTAGEIPPDKLRWTVLDGLRQLGAVTVPDRRVGAAIPEDLQYVALWVVRRRRGGPTRTAGEQLVAVRMRPGDDPHPITGWDEDRKDWVPYPQLLLKLARQVEVVAADDDNRHGHQERTPQEQREDIERHIRNILFRIRAEPTLLLGNAANLRSSWQWLSNGSLTIDQLGFGGDEPQRVAVYGPDLRFVLTRDSAGRGEVPQWYAPSHGERSAGLTTGLWRETDGLADNRVFVSLTDKPHTAKQPNGTMKLGPHPDWPKGPSVHAWNPQYLELLVVGCLSEKALADAGRDGIEPDQPSSWAAVAHQLRFHDDYVPLARPLPMHLAKLAEDYVLPVPPEEAEG
ncbi:pPIWI_RE module domain-containing protein [Actinoplanes teichomyceticus]|uniref:Uncharacterized protein DUF3893 n=1 Tax=Actinoplanes teichomyceticus TaxID=1867 RepID=A0A561VH13_ACTTI|nr:DUF3962 domain-containing protein [Actinoplanes teichomyceticus]TWG10897.1 uncharacterized protein DUF3893 [Actinoplanes teichomyceticus]GIF12481.1 hypothetical protein Ate01nite_25130 [Actinoplanes teichomyceticus]